MKFLHMIHKVEAIQISAILIYLAFSIWQHAADQDILPDHAIAVFVPYLLLSFLVIRDMDTDHYHGEYHGDAGIGQQQYRTERYSAKIIMALNLCIAVAYLMWVYHYEIESMAYYGPCILTFLWVGMVDLQWYMGSPLIPLLGSYQYGILTFGIKGMLILLGATIVIFFLISWLVDMFCDSIAMMDNVFVALSAMFYFKLLHYFVWLAVLIIVLIIMRHIIKCKTKYQYISTKPFIGVYACSVTLVTIICISILG